MTASWFVKSRGRSANEDYTWQGVHTADPAEADLIIERGWKGRPCFSLVDDERAGLLLFEDQRHGTVLLLTGLVPAEQPADYRHRVIRVTLLGVARHDDKEGQRCLIAVAVRALRDGLSASFPVSYGAAEGFAVVEGRWPEFIGQSLTALATAPDAHHDPGKSKLLPDTEEVRQWFADDLEALFDTPGLPALGGKIAVLRTNLIDPADWSRLKPWRTISDIATLPRTEVDLRPDPLGELAEMVKNTVRDHLGWIGGIICLLAIIVVVVLVLPQGSAVRPHQQPVKRTQGWRVADVIGSPSGVTTLDSTISLGPDYAMATGSTCDPGCPAPGPRLLIVFWNGKVWTRITSSAIPAASPEGVAVGASSATNAWILESTSGHSYALHWDGKNLSRQQVPGGLDFFAAAVVSPGAAWAFGTAPGGGTAVLQLAADRWHRVTLPAVPSPDPGGLSVLPGGDIWAAATTRDTAGLPPPRQVHVLLHWDGRSWQTISMPVLSLSKGEYITQIIVAARSPGEIWVAALISAAVAPREIVLSRLDGAASWSSVTVLRPASGLGALVQDGSGGVWLTDAYSSGPYHYSGGQWTAQPLPRQAGQAPRLSALSWIPGTTSVWAAGELSSTSPASGSRAAILKYGQ